MGRGLVAYQPRLGAPWFAVFSWPVYRPWRLFEWWGAYDAYAPAIFNEAGVIAASSGFAGIVVAVLGRCGAPGRTASSPPTARRAGRAGRRSREPACSTPQASFSGGSATGISATRALSM